MAEAKVRFRFDGADLERGLKGTGNRLESWAKGVGSTLVAAFAFDKIRKAYVDFEEDVAASNLLESSLKRIGGSADLVAQTFGKVGRAVRDLGADDTALNRALSELAIKVGDADAAMANLPIILDTSARFGLSYAESANVVANAMQGQIKQVAGLLPELKGLSDETGSLTGTAKGASIAMNTLWEAVGGAASEKAKTAAGQMEVFKTQMSEIGEDILGVVTASTQTSEIWQKINDWVYKTRAGVALLAAGIANLFDPKHTEERMKAFEERFREGLDEIDQRAIYGPAPEGKKEEPFKPRIAPTAGQWQKPEAGPEMKFDEMPYEMRSLFPGTGAEEGASGENPFARQMEAAMEELDSKQKAIEAKQKARLEELSATFSDLFSMTFEGMVGNWEDAVDRMRAYMIEKLIKTAAAYLGRIFAGGIMGAFSGGGGAIVDSPIGVDVVGGGAYASVSGGFGAAASASANLARRKARW